MLLAVFLIVIMGTAAAQETTTLGECLATLNMESAQVSYREDTTLSWRESLFNVPGEQELSALARLDSIDLVDFDNPDGDFYPTFHPIRYIYEVSNLSTIADGTRLHIKVVAWNSDESDYIVLINGPKTFHVNPDTGHVTGAYHHPTPGCSIYSVDRLQFTDLMAEFGQR